MSMARFTMPFMTALGAELVSAGGGRAEVRLTVRPDHLNGHGGAHGGVLAALIDIAVGAAAAVDLDGPGFRPNVTLAYTTQFLRPAPATGTLTARATVRGGGAQVSFVDAALSGPDGEVIATGTATLRLLSQ